MTNKTFKSIIAWFLILAMIPGSIGTGWVVEAATSYTITYNGNGGKTSDGRTTQTVTLESGKTSKTIKAGFFTKAGYTQTGWSTESSASKQNSSNTIGFQETVTHKKNVTYYAVWKANSSTTQYTITYNGNGGKTSDGRTTQTVTLASGKTSQTIKAGFFTKTGYTQTGWSTESSASKQNSSNTIGLQVTVTHNKNITYYAVWKANSYTVTFNSNGGTSVSSKKVTYNSTYGSLGTPSKTGYTFLGWYTALSGGSQVTTSTKVTITANQTLYAHWTQCPHTNCTEQIVSPGSCVSSGLKVRKCSACNKTWEIVIPARGHKYNINYDSKLNAECVHCLEPKYIGDMTLDELARSWYGEDICFDGWFVSDQKKILTKWIYSIMERADEKTKAKDVEAFVERMYGEKALADSNGFIFTLAEYGKTCADWAEYIDQINCLATISGYSGLSVYAKAASKYFLFVTICDPNMAWDQKIAVLITEVLPITGQILEGLIITGKTAVAIAEKYVADTVGTWALREIIDDVLDLPGGYDNVSMEMVALYNGDILRELNKKEYGLTPKVQKETYYNFLDLLAERNLNRLYSSK